MVSTGQRGKKIARQVTGFACLAVGVVGCVLPIIPGIPLLFAGLGLLAVDYPWAARLRDRLKQNAVRQYQRLRKKSSLKPEPVQVP